MDIKRNPDLISLISNIRLEIAEAGLAMLDSRWNNSDDERTLAVYLGLNADEEDVWIDESDEALQEMLDKQKA